jgi:prolyl oligopeptidase
MSIGYPRSSTLRATSLVVAVIIAGCAPSPWPAPPGTRRVSVVDTLHDVTFEDPYRWLEEQESPETRAWIAAQNAYAEAVVGESPIRDRFREALRRLMDVPDVGTAQKAGEFEYFTIRRSGEPLERLYRRRAPAKGDTTKPSMDGDYEIVLDPATLDSAHRTIVSPMDYSPDGRIMIYSVRQGGADEVEIRFRDLTTGKDLPDRLPNGLYGGVDFTPDGKAITYVHRSRENGPRLRRHMLGQDVAADSVLFGDGLPPTAFLSTDLVDRGRLRILNVQNGWAHNAVHLQNTATGEVRPLLPDSTAHLSVRWREGRLWILTDLGAPKNRLVTADPANPEPAKWTEILPESDDVLQSYVFIGDRIVATYLHEVSDRIRIFGMDGTPAGELEVPPFTTANIRAGDDSAAVLTLAGHLSPPTTYSVNLKTGERTVTDSAEVPFDPTGLVVEQTWFTSKDGTRSSMYVIHREGITLDGSHPTILTGYGGFNVALRPSFSGTAAAWVEMGGVWAIATLRGGNEFGEAWHRAGMLENKQNVFDDFIAAAEHLVATGYTSADHLGIAGSSNGGLLVAAAMTQRPDLFRAVLCTYPDLDMVRFYTFTANNNLPALLEYGDARIPSHFEAIRRYSPYQNVRDGVRYPAVMLATGDLDTRVPPLQARKMTARLQAATASRLPVILWYDERGGHAAGRGRPLELRVEDGARELTFMAQQLGLGGEPES